MELIRSDEIVPVDGKTSIGNIGNYYGGLAVFAERGKCYWGIKDYDDEYERQEIPLSLYLALLAFERDTKARKNAPDTDGQEGKRCS
jgi:hypothetical protein